jgi:hypothetical protein
VPEQPFIDRKVEIAADEPRRPLALRDARRADDDASLAARLAQLETAYADLLCRVRTYERERHEIKARVEQILSRIPRV